MQTKPMLVGYWVTTGVFAALFLASGVVGLAQVPANVAATRALGYPPYLLTILGVWKLLSVLALIAPRLPRLKEWAYAGIFFELTGAAASHAFSGDTPGRIATPLVLLLLPAVSWALRPPSRTWRPSPTGPKNVARLEDVPANA